LQYAAQTTIPSKAGIDAVLAQMLASDASRIAV